MDDQPAITTALTWSSLC